MSIQNIINGESGLSARTKINSNFLNLNSRTIVLESQVYINLIGNYDASTNIPDIATTTMNPGEARYVSVAGIQFGLDLQITDLIVRKKDDTGYFKIDNTQYSEIDDNNIALKTTYSSQKQVNSFEPKNSNIQTHIASTSNPHSVTYSQVGAEQADATIIKQANVVDNLTSESQVYPLSAKQGKVLQDSKEPNITKATAFNKNFETSTDNIKMNGVVAVGSSETIAHADHVHASDTTKANDNAVVHLTGNETISDIKDFLNGLKINSKAIVDVIYGLANNDKLTTQGYVDLLRDYLRVDEYWISPTKGSDTTGTGSRENPFASFSATGWTTIAINASHKLVYIDKSITQTIDATNWQNITFVGSPSVLDSQQVGWYGNHKFSGSSCTRLRFKDIILYNLLAGTATISLENPAIITKNTHNLRNGLIVYFTTTGSLPSPLVINTPYWVTKIDDNTFKLSDSEANYNSGIFISTDGSSQSGVHTLNVDDYIINFNGTAGRHYFNNTSLIVGTSKKAVKFTGTNARWHEFYDCYVGGIVDCSSSTTSMTIKLTRQLAAECNIQMNTYCEVKLYDCQRLDQIIHTNGKLYIDGLKEFWRTADNIGIISTAPASNNSYLEIKDSLLMRNSNPRVWMLINKTGDCNYAFINTTRDVANDVLTGTQLYLSNSKDISANHTAINYTADNASVSSHISAIDTKLGTLQPSGSYELTTNKNQANGYCGLDASGLVDIARLPDLVKSIQVDVADQTARFALTKTQVQNGDRVYQTDTATLYFVKDDNELDNEAGYQITTFAVNWSSVQSKPEWITVRPSATKELIIDGNRSDEYTEDGSFERPYKTLDAVPKLSGTLIKIYPKAVAYTENITTNASLKGVVKNTSINGNITINANVNIEDIACKIVNVSASSTFLNSTFEKLAVSGSAITQAWNTHIIGTAGNSAIEISSTGKVQHEMATIISTGDVNIISQSAGTLMIDKCAVYGGSLTEAVYKSTGGTCQLLQSQIVNQLGGVAIDLSGSGASASNPNMISNIAVIGNVVCGDKYTIVEGLHFINGIGTLSGTNIHYRKASMIEQDASNRFVSDTEKSTWNSKQDSLGFTPENSANKIITITDSDTEYPSSKAVKTQLDLKDTLLNGSSIAGTNKDDALTTLYRLLNESALDNKIDCSKDGIVVDNGANAYYPSMIYDANAFGANDGYNFKIIYSTGSALKVIKSKDCITWTTAESITGLASPAHHPSWVYSPAGFGTQGTVKYKLIYWKSDVSNLLISTLRCADSVDGITWTNDQPLTQDSTLKLITGNSGDINAGTWGFHKIFYNPNAKNTGSNPFDYTFTAYYDGNTGTTYQNTFLAYSSNFINWYGYYESGTIKTIIARSSDDVNKWDGYGASFSTCVRDINGYHFWYTGGSQTGGHTDNYGWGYAFSKDGITLATKDSSNPIFSVDDGDTTMDERCYTPTACNDESGTVYIIFTATGSAQTGRKKLALATLKYNCKNKNLNNINASSVSYSPTGNISATNVQDAITELDNQKQASLSITPSTSNAHQVVRIKEDGTGYETLINVPTYTTTQRDALVNVPTNHKIYNSTLSTFQSYNGTTWDNIGGSTSLVWGGITGTLSNQTDLNTALNGKQSIPSSSANYITKINNAGTGTEKSSLSQQATGIRLSMDGSFDRTFTISETENTSFAAKNATDGSFYSSGVHSTDGGFVYCKNNLPLRFALAENIDGGGFSEKARIHTNGYFGIGNNNPQYKLSVQTTESNTAAEFKNAGGIFRFNSNDGGWAYFQSGNVDWDGVLANGLRITGPFVDGDFLNIPTVQIQANKVKTKNFRASGGGIGNGYSFEDNGGDDDSGMYCLSDGELSFYTNSSRNVVIDGNGRTGIGYTSMTYKLQINGDTANTTGTIANISDRRAKNIQDISIAEIEKLSQLEIKKYQYKDYKNTNGTYYGFIAQDVYNKLPEQTTLFNQEKVFKLEQDALDYKLARENDGFDVEIVHNEEEKSIKTGEIIKQKEFVVKWQEIGILSQQNIIQAKLAELDKLKLIFKEQSLFFNYYDILEVYYYETTKQYKVVTKENREIFVNNSEKEKDKYLISIINYWSTLSNDNQIKSDLSYEKEQVIIDIKNICQEKILKAYPDYKQRNIDREAWKVNKLKLDKLLSNEILTQEESTYCIEKTIAQETMNDFINNLREKSNSLEELVNNQQSIEDLILIDINNNQYW